MADAPPPPLQMPANPYSPFFRFSAKWPVILAPDMLYGKRGKICRIVQIQLIHLQETEAKRHAAIIFFHKIQICLFRLEPCLCPTWHISWIIEQIIVHSNQVIQRWKFNHYPCLKYKIAYFRRIEAYYYTLQNKLMNRWTVSLMGHSDKKMTTSLISRSVCHIECLILVQFS